jgi:hypothetical protein
MSRKFDMRAVSRYFCFTSVARDRVKGCHLTISDLVHDVTGAVLATVRHHELMGIQCRVTIKRPVALVQNESHTAHSQKWD